jgi:hypothetical protein
MGILVAAFMLIGLLMSLPWVPPGLRVLRSKPRAVDVLASGLMLAGLWNALWYGLRHLSEFWGLAALISGCVMFAVAILLIVEHGSGGWHRHSFAVRLQSAIKPFRTSLVAGLAVCFVIYVVALVRLNLGLPIPG